MISFMMMVMMSSSREMSSVVSYFGMICLRVRIVVVSKVLIMNSSRIVVFVMSFVLILRDLSLVIILVLSSFILWWNSFWINVGMLVMSERSECLGVDFFVVFGLVMVGLIRILVC